ncbi:MAG: rhamnan synthesis F family protein, partial [Parvularcula sp.]|nr:rhamnan synthesis F family protein [Parvularcula sp.]
SFNEAGIQNAWNPPASEHRPLSIPFDYGTAPTGGVLGIIHCFYLDEAEQILDLIAAAGTPMRLILTTDTEDKRQRLDAMLTARGIDGRAARTPNRGRDVAPFLMQLKSDTGNEEFVFHLHTKKSTYNDRYAGWGPYLRHNLIGSAAILSSVLALLSDDTVGIVYPEHHPEIAPARNWGYNFVRTRSLLERAGINVDARTPLEFPTGTMFFARREIFAPLLALHIDYDDFDEEGGQLDGTLAHGIERSLVYLAEARGLRSIKVLDTATYPPPEGSHPVKSSDIRYYLKQAARRLLTNGVMSPPFTKTARQIYPVSTAASERPGKRLNLLVPTLQPSKVYGGVATALRVFREIADAAPDTALRVIVTSDRVDAASLDLAADRLGRHAAKTSPNTEEAVDLAVVPLHEDRSRPVSLRKGDAFLATAWWTADLGFRLRGAQAQIFGNAPPLGYLIQDYEPSFYPASAVAALAEATYGRSDETFAIVNSEELAQFFSKLTGTENRAVLPFTIDAGLEAHIAPAPKEPILLCYGRPSTPRNAFPLMLDALKLFQAQDPQLAEGWRIVFAGEEFPESEIRGIAHAETVGKLPLDLYGNLLSRASVGLSLMMSPHPSYPPLEMARAGLKVVTNGHGPKDLSVRTPHIISVKHPTAEELAAALKLAVGRAKLGEVRPLIDLAAPKLEGWPSYDPRIVAAALLQGSGA